MRIRNTVAVVLFALPLLAADQSEIRRIPNRFVVPSWQQRVASHDSEIARELRVTIPHMPATGESAEQFVATYAARDGERIVRESHGAKRWCRTVVRVVSNVLATAGLAAFIVRGNALTPYTARAVPRTGKQWCQNRDTSGFEARIWLVKLPASGRKIG